MGRGYTQAMRRLLRSRAGQIVIPAMLIFPTLFLFVYLIYETAKLSRYKINHQFAMDAAAFVEMANYSDFLNRSAYVNGAFPMRIFQEGYGGPTPFKAECDGKTNNCQPATYEDMLYANGAFPRSAAPIQPTDPSWKIEYCTKSPSPFSCSADATAKNGGGGRPTMPAKFMLFIDADAYQYWHQMDLATQIYQLYVQVFGLLGSVEAAQYSVLQRLDAEHSFLVKSYWLNTGDPISSADPLKAEFRRQMPDFQTEGSGKAVEPMCIKQLQYWGNKLTPGGLGIEPMQPFQTSVIDMTDAATNKVPQMTGCAGGGLFQLMWVDTQEIGKMKTGIPLSMPWAYPQKNFWGVDFSHLINNGPPLIHTTISLGGDSDRGMIPSVWPNPTPKFQVREKP